MRRLYLSSSCVRCDDIVATVRALATISPQIELSGGSRYRAGSLEELRAARAELGLDFLLHGYFPPPRADFLFNFADRSVITREFVDTAMRYVHELEIPYYSVHAGFRRDFRIVGESLMDGTREFSPDDILENLQWFSSKYPDVLLAIENLYPVGGDTASCFAMTVDEIEWLLGADARTRLLLDLGHLRVSAHHLGFDWADAVDRLFSRHAGRIVELHLSENAGEGDDHGLVTADSPQFRVLERYRELIERHGMRLTIEARGAAPAALAASYALIRGLFTEEP